MMIIEAEFWHVDVGQIAVAVVVAAAWLVNKFADYSNVRSRIEYQDNWNEVHSKEAEGRDAAIEKIGNAITRLTTLAEGQEYRVRNLESRHIQRP